MGGRVVSVANWQSWGLWFDPSRSQNVLHCLFALNFNLKLIFFLNGVRPPFLFFPISEARKRLDRFQVSSLYMVDDDFTTQMSQINEPLLSDITNWTGNCTFKAINRVLTNEYITIYDWKLDCMQIARQLLDDPRLKWWINQIIGDIGDRYNQR